MARMAPLFRSSATRAPSVSGTNLSFRRESSSSTPITSPQMGNPGSKCPAWEEVESSTAPRWPEKSAMTIFPRTSTTAPRTFWPTRGGGTPPFAAGFSLSTRPLLLVQFLEPLAIGRLGIFLQVEIQCGVNL